ncbi:hypothetical protein CAPTEDRAFT_202163 [Capitella teleta]|uniref:UspA domain-containing protein n=1 Tax=Capitella teleta TaxID=283909 RepID=R7UBW9_CAPTE|nr:hypothetical protein CAPTEDRAFT_202163 [Capitella teleta]|eukprot:ELU00767.1 hypothetical protein CAPTEDRAFT_202163 [Capitella teleta]
MACGDGERRVVALAVDSSEYAEYAFDWFAKYFHRPEHEVILVHIAEGFDITKARYAKYLHRQPNEIVCLHVPERFDMQKAQKEMARSGSMKEATEKQYSKITELEERFQHKMRQHNMRGTVLSVPSKTPGQTILETAREEKAFCIVMGTRGRSAIKKAILGSVSDHLIKNADIPVIVVRKRKDEVAP